MDILAYSAVENFLRRSSRNGHGRGDAMAAVL